MKKQPLPPGEATVNAFRSGDEMAQAIRAKDWSQTALGPIDRWPVYLRASVDLCVGSSLPTAIAWGRARVHLFNDAYRDLRSPKRSDSPGRDNPGRDGVSRDRGRDSLGRDIREFWSQAWSALREPFEQAFNGTPRGLEQRVFLDCEGRLAERFFTVSLSPIRSDGGEVHGVLHQVIDQTQSMLAARRTTLLQALAASARNAASEDEASRLFSETLRAGELDVPFALLYQASDGASDESPRARLLACAGLAPGHAASPQLIPLHDSMPWPLAAVESTNEPLQVDGLAARFGAWKCGPYPEPPNLALVYRLPSSTGAPDAFLIAGVSARRELDAPYREFFDRLASASSEYLERAREQAGRRQRATAVAAIEHDLSELALEVAATEATVEMPTLPREPHSPGLLPQLLGGMREAFAVFDREWRYVWINPAAAALTGHEPADLPGRTLWDVQPRWLDAVLEDACLHAMAGEAQQLTCWSAELERWLEHQIEPTADGCLWFTRDITAERSAARALAESEERLRLATQTGKVGLWYWDVLKDRAEWTDSIYPMHGISPQQFDGTKDTFLKLVHPDDRTRVANAIQATLADEAPYEIEFRVQKPNGEVAWLFANATALRDEDGRVVRLLGAIVDIDQRKRTELALRESEERFAKAFHSSPLILTIAACDSGELLEVNATFTRVCGYAREAVLGRTIQELGLSIHRSGTGSDAAIERTTSLNNAECRLRTREGTDLVGVLSTELIEIGGRPCMLTVIQDITERKRAEEALRASEQRFARFMQHLPGLAWIKDLTGHYVFTSENTAKIFGRPQKDIYGKTDADLFDTDTAAQFSRHDRQALASETGIQVIETLSYADGSQHHSIVNKFPIQDASGKAMLIGGVAIDITEQKRREVALAESEARFRMVVDNIAALAWTADDTGRMTWVNRRWNEYVGLTLEQYVERDRFEPIHPEHASRVRQSLAASVRSGQLWEETFPLRGSNGEYRWFLSRAVPIRDESGTVVQWFGTNTDITDHQMAEQAAHRQTERLRLLWEAAAQLLVMEDPETILQELFGRIAPHFGLDAYFHYVLDEEAGVLRLHSSAGVDDTAVLDAWRELRYEESLAGRANHESFIAAFLQRAAADPSTERLRTLGLRCFVSNPLLVGERLLGTLSFASRSHDEFAPDDLEFFRTISSYTTVAHERLRLLRELKDTDRRKDEFLATLAHELRNPLAPIRNGLEIIRMTRGNPDKMEQARLMMERQLQQMVRLIDDLLDLSRISRGKIELRRERVDLRIVLQHAVETSRPLIERHRHQLTLDIPQSPALFVEADLTRLAQVFANLLNNSAKYTPNGGEIELSLREEDGQAVVAVRDNGDGIPAHMLARVFDMFAQVDRSIDRPSAGLGIGLNIVKRLVEMHGGTVSVTSAGRSLGSEFVVRLPLLQVQHAASLLLDAEMISANPAGCRVLVADDNVDAAVSLATLLKMLGHDVRTAHDGQEAVDIASAFLPELILLDIGMPKLDGYDACTRIRELPVGNDSLVVALSIWGNEDDKDRATAAGFDAHLVKPIDAADLERLLTRVSG